MDRKVTTMGQIISQERALPGRDACVLPAPACEVLVITRSATMVERVVVNLAAPAQVCYRVTAARDVASALPLLADHHFAALLYDGMTPEADPGERCGLLRAAAPGTAIIVLARDDDESQAVEALRCGAQDYVLASDFSPGRLSRLVHSAIQRHAHEVAGDELVRRAAITLDSIGDAVLSIDMEGRVSYLNRVAEIMTGWACSDALGKPLAAVFRLIDEMSRLPVPHPLLRALQENRTVELTANCLLVRQDGYEYLIEDSAAPIRAQDGQVSGAVIVFRDVSRLRANARDMTHLAQHDALTDLPNRLLFSERVASAIVVARRHKRLFALLYLDLDGFKCINDSLGHGCGDQLLRSVAGRLVAGVRASDTVCRQGGDEFVVLLSEVEGAADAAASAATILRTLAAPYAIDSHQLEITASIGISLYPRDGRDGETLLRCADSAMYRAKRGGRNRVVFFTAR